MPVYQTREQIGVRIAQALTDSEERAEKLREERRQAALLFRRVEGKAPQPIPLRGTPTVTPTPTPRIILPQNQPSALHPGYFQTPTGVGTAPTLPLAPPRPEFQSVKAVTGTVKRALGEAEKRVYKPIGLAGGRAVEAVPPPGVRELAMGAELAGVDTGFAFSIEESLGKLREIPRDVDVAARAAIGGEKEQAELDARLAEVGVAPQIIAQVLFDPLNLIPVLGFTKVDDFVRAVRAVRRGVRTGEEGALGRKLTTGLRRLTVEEAGGAKLPRGSPLGDKWRQMVAEIDAMTPGQQLREFGVSGGEAYRRAGFGRLFTGSSAGDVARIKKAVKTAGGSRAYILDQAALADTLEARRVPLQEPLGKPPARAVPSGGGAVGKYGRPIEAFPGADTSVPIRVVATRMPSGHGFGVFNLDQGSYFGVKGRGGRAAETLEEAAEAANETNRRMAAEWPMEKALGFNAPAAPPAGRTAAKARPTRTPPSRKRLPRPQDISDFEIGRDQVVRRGNRTFVIDTGGERAEIEVISDVLTPELEANFQKLTSGQQARMVQEVRQTPYLSAEGKAERLRLMEPVEGAPVRPSEGGAVPPREPPKLGQDIPDPHARTVQDIDPPPPPPPDAPPPSIGDGLTGEPQTPGGLLARFQDRLPGRRIQTSDWAKYTGGLAAEGKDIELAMGRFSSVARKSGIKRVLSRTRNAENEAMLKALHGEGPIPAKAQGLYGELQGFFRLHEQRTIGDVPSFQNSLLPQYFPRAWRNAAEKIDEYRLGQALERGAISPEVFRGEHAKLVGGGKLGPGAKPGTLRTRTLPETFTEAIADGWEPLSWNPVDLAGLHAAELADYRYSTVLGDLWKMEGRAIPKSAAPTSWKTPDYPAFASRPYVDASGAARMSEPLVVAPEDFALLEDMLGRRPTDITDVMAYTTSVFKRSKVALGLFQHIDLTNRLVIRSLTRGEAGFLAPGVKAMAANFVPTLRPRLMRSLLRDPEIREMTEEGLQLTGGLDVFKRETRMALEPDLVVRLPILGDLPLQRLPGGARKGAQRVQNVLNGIYGYMGKGLFDGAQPQYMGAFAKSVRREVAAAHPELTSRQISALAAETANNMMSNIPQWQSVLSPRLRQLARGAAFSVNEGEGWLRQMTKTVYKGKEPGMRGTYLRQWAGYIFGTLAIAEVINYAMTGELLSGDQMQPITFTNGHPNYNSKFARPRLDGNGPLSLGIKGAPVTDENGNVTGYRHVYMDLMGQADTPFRALNPMFFVQTRLSPQLSAAAQVYKGEKYFGRQPLEGPGAKAKFALQQLLEPIPVSSFTQEKGRIGAVGAAIQSAGVNISGENLRAVLERTRAQVMREKGISGDYETLKAQDSPRAAEIDNDPRVQAVFAEVQRSTARMAPTPESQFFAETEVTRAEQRSLQEAADAKFNSGQWAGEVWRQDFFTRQRDFASQREGVKRALKVEFAEKATPPESVNAAVNAYFSVIPDDYVQPDGTTDWDGFSGAQDAALSSLSGTDRRRVMAFIHKYDTPTVTRFRVAQDLAERFYDMPRFLSAVKNQGALTEIDRLAQQKRLEFARRGFTEVDMETVYAMVGRDTGDMKTAMRAYQVRPGSKLGKELRNPERDRFLVRNVRLLEMFFPELYESERIQLRVGLQETSGVR